MKTEEIDKLKEAGLIAQQVIEYARSFIVKDMLLVDISNKIEDKILELNAKPAFPNTLSINEVAAHATPAFNDEAKAHGLLKVDIGIHIDGYIADTAFTMDLEDNEENKKLIESAEAALKKAMNIIKNGTELREIGKVIETTVKEFGFTPIQNLSGHSIDPWDLHSGITIPNFDNSSDTEIEPGVYAVEPFTTTGLGQVRDGKPSGIYHLENEGQVRDSFAREVLNYIKEEYKTLPFCSRWIHKKFGSRGLLALRQIEQAGFLHHYKQLVEKSGAKVAQAENTVIILKDKNIVTTS